jgi:hypothetical protein
MACLQTHYIIGIHKGEFMTYIEKILIGYIFLIVSFGLLSAYLETKCLSAGYPDYKMGYCVDKFNGKAVRVGEVGL